MGIALHSEGICLLVVAIEVDLFAPESASSGARSASALGIAVY